MCFSATASFVTAGMTAVVGVVSLSRVNDSREAPLAAAPLIFALQQSIEGLLWLDLSVAPDGPIPTSLTFIFLLFANVFWPVYAPTAVLLIESNERRRRLMFICLAIGVGVSAQMLWWILSRPYGAAIQEDHIVYLTNYTPSPVLAVAYLSATGLPLVLSSHRTVVALGAVILVGSAVAFVLYWEAFVSVWCFFAGAASLVILGHFEWSRRQRPRIASA